MAKKETSETTLCSLLERFKADKESEGALKELLQRLKAPVHGYLRKRFEDEHVVQQAASGAFAALALKPHLFPTDNDGVLTAYVMRVAVTEGLQFVRRNIRHIRGHQPIDNVDPPDPRIRDPADAAPASQNLLRALVALPNQQFKIVMLHEIMGYTHGEIAGELKIAEGTSRVQLTQARARMREKILEDTK